MNQRERGRESKEWKRVDKKLEDGLIIEEIASLWKEFTSITKPWFERDDQKIQGRNRREGKKYKEREKRE